MISAVSWIPKGVLKLVQAEPPSKEEIEEKLKGQRRTLSDIEVEVMNVDTTTNQDDEFAHALSYNSGSMGVEHDTDSMPDSLKDLNMCTVLSEELEDITIKHEESVIICARNEDDFNHLKVLIIDESEEGDPNIYVYHNIVIPASPLCLAWLDFPLNGGEKGKYIAVGSMEPAIEIWDLDVMDEVQPSAILGGIIEDNKKGKKQSIKYKEDSHTDAVLGLAWNKVNSKLLASASADNLVKIWDVSIGKCCNTMDHHTDKSRDEYVRRTLVGETNYASSPSFYYLLEEGQVQAVAWYPFDQHILLTGSFDHSVVVKDIRAPSHTLMKFQLTADGESLAWDPHNIGCFAVSVEDGMVSGFDGRISEPSFSLHAHDEAVCSISYNPFIPNLLATGSKDKWVKLWDLSNNQPSCITSKNLKAGKVFSLSFSNDSPFFLAVGGSKGKFELWDLRSDDAFCARYPDKIRHIGGRL